MKVIHVTWEAARYGISTFLLNLLPYQNNTFTDIKADIVFHKTNEEGEGRFRQMGIKFYSLGALTAKDIRLFINFYKLFMDYDLVNLHTHSPLAFFAAKLARKKVVFTFHGAMGFKGKWSDIFIKIFHYFILMKYCDYYTFASKSSFNRYFAGHRGIVSKFKRYQIFPYGVQIANIIPKKFKIDVRKSFNWNSKFLIGTAARMDSYKRLEYLIEAFYKTKCKEECLLIIMGTGHSWYERYLKNLVSQLKLNKYVNFLGYRQDVYDILNALNMFVLPTKEESFGLALLEAMALGIPCIVFRDGGGTVDILGESGIIVNSIEELSDAIEKLQKDGHLRDELSREAKKRAKLFDISYTAKNLYDIYYKLIRKNE